MKYLAILPLLLMAHFSFAQEKKEYSFDYQIVYQMTYQTDSNNVKSIKKEYLELLTNDNISLFRSIKAGRLDSAMYSELSKGNMLGPSVSVVMENYSTITYKILKEKANNRILTFDQPGNVTTSAFYVESLDKLDWEIKSDTATINGLKCQRADLNFGNRKWSAWFAVEVPINDGPYKFAGLPGLVVRIADNQKYWNFDMLSLNKIKKEVIINFDPKMTPIRMEKKDFFKSKRNYIDNSLQMDEAAGLIRGFSSPRDREIILKSYKERALKDNNWIELYKIN